MTAFRICLISREFPPDTAFGGIARISEMEADALAQLGHEVHVVTLGQKRYSEIRDNGVIVHRIPHPQIPVPHEATYMMSGLWALQVAAFYDEIDRAVRFDAVHVQDYFAEGLHLRLRPDTLRVARGHALSAVVNMHAQRERSPGERGFEALEHAALDLADRIVIPTQLLADETIKLVPSVADRVLITPPPFDAARFPLRPEFDDPQLRLLFVGRLEPLKGPDLALRTLAKARETGVDAVLTLVGRDVPQNGTSYRTGTLIPLMADLGLDFSAVRFVDQLDAEGVQRHLRYAHAVIAPSAFENMHAVSLEALSSGVPVVARVPNGLAHWFGPREGFLHAPTDPDEFVQTAAAAVTDSLFRQAAVDGAAKLRDVCDPKKVFGQQLRSYPACDRQLRTDGPNMAVVILCHNQRAYTQLAVESLLRSTGAPMTVYLVDNASTDDTPQWAASVTDPRFRYLRSDRNAGVSGGRNIGIRAALADHGHEVIAFLDNDVLVYHDWWAPLWETLEQYPETGISGQLAVDLTYHGDGRRSDRTVTERSETADLVVGFCMFMRRAVVEQVGLFDEALGLFWHDDDDYCMRAKRIGWQVRPSGTSSVVHFEHKSSAVVDGIWEDADTGKPSEMSIRNREYHQDKQQYLRGLRSMIADTRDVCVVAWASELLEHPELIVSYAQQFNADDLVSLLIWPDVPGDTLVEDLQAATQRAGAADAFDGFDVLIGDTDGYDAEMIGALADAVLSERPAVGPFHAPPHFGVSDGAALRALVQRRWSRLRELA